MIENLEQEQNWVKWPDQIQFFLKARIHSFALIVLKFQGQN